MTEGQGSTEKHVVEHAGFGGGKRYQAEGATWNPDAQLEFADHDLFVDENAIKLDSAEDYDEELGKKENQMLHYHYNFKNFIGAQASQHPLLFEALDLFRISSDRTCVYGIVQQSLEEQVSCCSSFGWPIMIGLLVFCIAGLVDLLVFDMEDLKFKIGIPVILMVLAWIVGLLVSCLSVHSAARKNLLMKATQLQHHNVGKIIHRIDEYRRLEIDHRIAILAHAIAPVKELIIRKTSLPGRGSSHYQAFIQESKIELRNLMQGLRLKEDFGECKDILLQYASAQPQQVILEASCEQTPMGGTTAGKGDAEAMTRATTIQPSNSQNVSVAAENKARLELAKKLSLQKLYHLDMVFKLYAPLWCLENGYAGTWETNRISSEDYMIRTKSQKQRAGRITTTFLDEEVFATLNKLYNLEEMSNLLHSSLLRNNQMRKSRKLVQEALTTFWNRPGLLNNNKTIIEMEANLKNTFSLAVVHRIPNTDGFIPANMDLLDSFLDVENANKAPVYNTQMSIEFEILGKKNAQQYIGDSQSFSVYNKARTNKELSELDISRGSDDPNYKEEYGQKQKEIQRKMSIKESIREDPAEDIEDPQAGAPDISEELEGNALAKAIDSEPVDDLEDMEEEELENERVIVRDIYSGYDGLPWDKQFDNEHMQQWRHEENPDLIEIKTVAQIRAKPESVLEMITNSSYRMKWETTLHDFKYCDQNSDWSSQRIHFVYRNAAVTFSKVIDREINLQQKVWKNFPQPDCTTVHYTSIEEKRWPCHPNNKVMHCNYLAYVIKPKMVKFETHEEEASEVMMMSNFQKNGFEPKFLLTIAVGRQPCEWFNDLDRVCRQFEEGSLKPEDYQTPGADPSENAMIDPEEQI